MQDSFSSQTIYSKLQWYREDTINHIQYLQNMTRWMSGWGYGI